MPTYSDSQREYWVKRPRETIHFDTVEFYHPDFGYERLVANQYEDRQFSVNDTLETFQAVAMKVPKVTNQSTDDTQQAMLSFGRIGKNFRETLLKITPLGSIKYSIVAVIRQYEGGIAAPIYERRLYVDKDGISIDANNVSVRLSVNNPAKLTNEAAFYSPSKWIGLQTT